MEDSFFMENSEIVTIVISRIISHWLKQNVFTVIIVIILVKDFDCLDRTSFVKRSWLYIKNVMEKIND